MSETSVLDLQVLELVETAEEHSVTAGPSSNLSVGGCQPSNLSVTLCGPPSNLSVTGCD